MKTKIYLSAIATFISLLSFAQPGSLDETFGRGGKATPVFGQYGSEAEGVAIQTDKKLIVVGKQFNAANNEFEVIRFNSDGSLDKTFGTKGNVHTLISGTCGARSVAIQPDGKIVVVGTCSDFTTPSMAVARYNEDGTLDSDFNGTGTAIISFGNSYAEAYSLVIQPDGKIVIGGDIRDAEDGDILKFALARLKADGTIDDNFGNHGKVVSGFNGKHAYAYKILLQADNKIIAAGTIRNTNDDDFAVIRYKANGNIDESFGTTGKLIADFGGDDGGTAAALQSDGKIIVAGVSSISFVYSFAMIRYKKNGTPDNSFGTNGKATNDFGGVISSIGDRIGIAIQADSKILLAGQGSPEHSVSGNYADFAIARFELNGDADNNFGTNGLVRTDFRRKTDAAHDILIQPNGKIVVVGESTSSLTYAVARYNPGGSALNEAMTGKTNITIPIETAVNIFPNPVQNELHIRGLGITTEKKLSVVDVSGNILKTVNTKQDELFWDIQSIPAGIYYLRIQHDSKITSLKFVKQ